MGYKDSAEWCAICALRLVQDAIRDLANGERSPENAVEDLPELEQLLIELRSKVPDGGRNRATRP